jgi:16S rRNA (guanine1516-N2)-methyltransferase
LKSTIIVTTVKDKAELAARAKSLAMELNCFFVERKDRSLATLAEIYKHEITIVVGEKHIAARIGSEEFFFHPSMALLRLMNYLKGDPDRMAEAMDIQPGMTVLDCTLGFGTDALVASFLTGPAGKVVGLEASEVVSALVRYGMKDYRPRLHSGLDPHKAQVLSRLPDAIGRIEVIHTKHLPFLQSLPDKSVDIIYFDPMFRKPCEDSTSISPLRTLALPDQIDLLTIDEACRVARHRVVLKEGRYSREFTRLGFEVVPGGKYSQVAFGIINIGG